MPKLEKHQWDEIRSRWEMGEAMCALAKEFPISVAAISAKAKKQGWIQDLDKAAVMRATNAKLAQVPPGTVDPAEKAKYIDREATKRSAVLMRHRKDWIKVWSLLMLGLKDTTADPKLVQVNTAKIKAAKDAAQALLTIQQGETKAWRLDDGTNVSLEEILVGLPRSFAEAVRSEIARAVHA